MPSSRREFIKSTSALTMTSLATTTGLTSSLLAATKSDIEKRYAQAIIIDTLSFAFKWNDKDIENWRRSGYTGIFESLPRRTLKEALDALVTWHQRIAKQPDIFTMALTANDFKTAKSEGKLAVHSRKRSCSWISKT